MLTRFLLVELINAAEGVERAHIQARAYAVAAQRAADDHFREHPDLLALTEPGYNRGWDSDDVTGVWYELINMIVWARAVDDRVQRPGRRGDPLQGLLPALAPGPLYDKVQHALGQLREGAAGEARILANYSVHCGIFPTPGTPNGLAIDGQLSYIMADPPTTAVDHWYELTFAESRDALVFAEQLMVQIVEFINSVLDAFAAAVPERIATTLPPTPSDPGR